MNDRSNVFLVGWKNEPGNICITEVPKKDVSWICSEPGIFFRVIEELELVEYTFGEFFNYIAIESSKDTVCLKDCNSFDSAKDAMRPSDDDSHSYIYDVKSGKLDKIYSN